MRHGKNISVGVVPCFACGLPIRRHHLPPATIYWCGRHDCPAVALPSPHAGLTWQEIDVGGGAFGYVQAARVVPINPNRQQVLISDPAEAHGDPLAGRVILRKDEEQRTRREAESMQERMTRAAEDEAARRKQELDMLRATTTLVPGVYPSIAAAKRAGFVDWKKWLYGGERLEIKGHVLLRGQKEAISQTAWRTRGFVVLPSAEPHAWRTVRLASAKAVTYALYRDDQVVALADWKATDRRLRVGMVRRNDG